MLEHEELALLRRMIEQRRAALARELRADAARAQDENFAALAGEVKDAGDESVADLLADVDQAELSRDLQELRELDAALERFLNGRYSRCTDCGMDIDLDRLRAQPAAVRCIACQGVHEKTYVQPSGTKL